MNIWLVFNIMVWIFAVIGVLGSVVYTVGTWCMYKAVKISFPQDGSRSNFYFSVAWPILALMVAGDIMQSEVRRQKREKDPKSVHVCD